MKKILKTILILSLFSYIHGQDIVPDSYEYRHSIAEWQSNHRQKLPVRMDFSTSMPPARNRGEQKSGAAWAVSYAAYSYMKFGSQAKNKQFSPAYTYHLLNEKQNRPISILAALRSLANHGAVLWSDMPYKQWNYFHKPSGRLKRKGSRNRIHSFFRITYTEPQIIKQALVAQKPVIAAILVTPEFDKLKAQQVYQKQKQNQKWQGRAVVLVGYDDSKRAFKIQDAGNQKWADKGFGYIDYQLFARICQSAYIIGEFNRPQLQPTGMQQQESFTGAIQVARGSRSFPMFISWQPVAGAIGYEVLRAEPNQTQYLLAGKTTNHYFLDNGISARAAYRYQIVAITESGKIVNKMIASGHLRTNGMQPPKVSGLTASHGKYVDKIHLTWTHIPGVQKYEIFRWREKLQTYYSIGNSSDPSFVDHNITCNGCAETYTVAAYWNGKMGEPSQAVIGYTNYQEKPKPPTGLLVSKGDFAQKIRIVWNPVDAVSEYSIYRFYNNHWQKVATSQREIFEDTSPPTGKVYYVVAAKDKAGNWSEYSTPEFGYTTAFARRTGPEAIHYPESLRYEMVEKESKIKLYWQNTQKATTYIWQKKSNNPDWRMVSKTKSNTFSLRLPEKDRFFLYTVTYHRQPPQNQNFPTPVSVVDSSLRKSKFTYQKRAFDKTSALEKFKGKWVGLHWCNDGSMRNVILKINGDKRNENFEIIVDNKNILQGKYIEDSSVLEVDGKIQVNLSYTESSLIVNFEDPNFLKQKAMLSFLRE